MTLIRWEPFREVDTLQRQMNRLFESLVTATDQEPGGISFIPPAQLEETPDALILQLEVPGIDADALDVQVTADAVAITGERKQETKTEAKGMNRTEFRYGKFERVIPLPTRVQNTNAEAKYQNGILTLTLPKAEEEKHKVVKVNIA